MRSGIEGEHSAEQRWQRASVEGTAYRRLIYSLRDG